MKHKLTFTVHGANQAELQVKMTREIASYLSLSYDEVVRMLDNGALRHHVHAQASEIVHDGSGYSRVVMWEANVDIEVNV